MEVKQTAFKYIDLHLPFYKTTTVPKLKKTTFFDAINSLETPTKNPNPYDYSNQKKSTSNTAMTAAVGTKDAIYHNTNPDLGLFGTIYEAWANHLNIKTCPEDWWLPVITRVATLVDNYADSPSLRNYFVGGRPGKEEIVVNVPSFTIYDTDYTYVFNSFSEQINSKIKVPGYVDTISSSFSTTSPDQRIGSQITIMKSFQKYFDYTMGICGCGIRGIEMGGSEQDWIALKEKFVNLKKLLAPIESTIQISEFFTFVEPVFDNLLLTYQGKNMDDWWSKVLIDCKEVEYGPSGMSKGHVDAYNGWIIGFCSGRKYPLKAKNLASGDYNKELSCISSCPMKIVDRIRNISDSSTLKAGILGFSLDTDSLHGATLRPSHGWTLLLPPSSPLRSK